MYVYQIYPLVLNRPNQHSFCMLLLPCMVNLALSELSQPPMPKVCLVHPEITLDSCVPVQLGLCNFSDVTLTDSQSDNSIHAPPASRQSGQPSWGYWQSCQPVWDVSVKAHPVCHSVSLPGHCGIRLLFPFHPSFPPISFSLFHSLYVSCLFSFRDRAAP